MSVLVGKPAPDFVAPTVLSNNQIDENFSFSGFRNGKYAVLFFYPLDFTFVCPTEIIAFDHGLADFEERNTVVIGCSIDSQYSHLAWKNTPVKKGGIGQVKYPLVADLTKNIARDYDVLFNESIALRGSFLIDREGIVRHQVINDLPLGRSMHEMIRMVDALQFHEEHGDVCPADWEKGKEAMKGTPEGTAEYLAKHA